MAKVIIVGTAGWENARESVAPYLSVVGNGMVYKASLSGKSGMYTIDFGPIVMDVHPEDVKVLEE
jgi:hypothetical protein